MLSRLYAGFLQSLYSVNALQTPNNNSDDTSFIAITAMYKNDTSSVKYKGLIS